MLTRREALTGIGVAGASTAQIAKASHATNRNDGAEAALRAFLRAFENCDLPRMEMAFAADATYFDRAVDAVDDPNLYRRGKGMPAGMRQLAMALPRSTPGPPYHRIEPQNLMCDVLGAVALCTFELENSDNIGRRTVALRRQNDGWKIIHIHASNVYRAAFKPGPQAQPG